MYECIYTYICIYKHIYTCIYATSQNYLATLKNILFLILKVLFLMKQVKHHNHFIYYTKYKSFLATSNTN